MNDKDRFNKDDFGKYTSYTVSDGEVDDTNKGKNKKKYSKYVLTSLVSGAIGALLFSSVFASNIKENDNASDITIAASEDTSIPEAVAEKTMESVVGITTKQVQTQRDLFNGLKEEVVEGVGSGVIISEDGYILTNSHVVSDGSAQDVKVLFEDGSEKDAQLIWNDATLDLAVIKADAKGLKPASLGDSDKINIGETAIAIGNPLGLEFERTVTSGIISGLNRSLQVSDAYSMEGLIQTDASINSGNSGGPLLNKQGEVIGINTLKIQSGEGMGFAQPINIAKPFIDEIIKTGTFEDVYLGIYGGDALKYQKTTGEDIGTDRGVIVTAVEEESPSDIAGIKPGDIIVSINGDNVDSFQNLKETLCKYKPGETIKVGVIRDKQSEDINIELVGKDKI